MPIALWFNSLIEIFQRRVNQAVKTGGVLVIADDILVYGVEDSEKEALFHSTTDSLVRGFIVRRFRERNIALNRDNLKQKQEKSLIHLIHGTSSR